MSERDEHNEERRTETPERLDTNEKADDIATVVDPDGSEVVEAISTEQGRVGRGEDTPPT